jgi:hypothetical protein
MSAAAQFGDAFLVEAACYLPGRQTFSDGADVDRHGSLIGGDCSQLPLRRTPGRSKRKGCEHSDDDRAKLVNPVQGLVVHDFTVGIFWNREAAPNEKAPGVSAAARATLRG